MASTGGFGGRAGNYFQIPAMAKSGNNGSIIVDSSTLGSRVSALPVMQTSGVYAASKAGANMLVKYAAIEVSLLYTLEST